MGTKLDRIGMGQDSRHLSHHHTARLASEVAIVVGVILLWLALAQPSPAKPNLAFEPKNCSFMEREGNPCAPVLPLRRQTLKMVAEPVPRLAHYANRRLAQELDPQSLAFAGIHRNILILPLAA